jgi:hypothetical protein
MHADVVVLFHNVILLKGQREAWLRRSVCKLSEQLRQHTAATIASLEEQGLNTTTASL